MELNQILLQIDSLKKEAEGLQPVKPELEKIFWDKFRLEFNYNSNHLEGNTLTYGHTQILLKSGDVVGKYNIRELQEMKAHDLALKIIRESSDDPEFHLSQKFIKEINQLILVEPFYNEAITQDGKSTQKLITPGEYKKTPNSVLLPNGEMYFYPSPEETPALMSDLIDWYEKEKDAKELHPVQIAALFHYKIVRIHPFDDSNGRTARLLANYIFLKNGFAPQVIESKDKKNYLRALNEADAGDLNAFIDYIINIQLRWQELFLRALKGEKIEQPEDFEKEVEILKKSLKDKQKATQRISEEVVLSLFKNSVLKLLESVVAKLSLFNSFSHSIIIRFGLDKNYLPIVSSDFSGNITSLFLNDKDKLTNGGTIDLQYVLKGVTTKENKIVDLYSEISVRLKEYTFYIETEQNSNPIFEKKYGEGLSASEIEEIALLIGKKTLQKIKG
jgi:Fic family protein